MANRIYIFDTTLRDGEQSPGASLNVEEKLEIARQLGKPLLVLVLTVLSVLAAGILFWTFAAISLSTVDWFVF